MLDPATIKPYVDLITWQVVALFGGLFFAPAIYLVVFRLRTLSMGLVTAGLTQREVRQITQEVEREAEEEADESPVAPQQAAMDISTLEEEDPQDKKEMYENVVQAWSKLATIVRNLAVPHGGQANLKAYLANLDIIARMQLLEPAEIQRLRELHHRRHELGRNTRLLTQQTYKAYLRRARRTANRLNSKLLPQSADGKPNDGGLQPLH